MVKMQVTAKITGLDQLRSRMAAVEQRMRTNAENGVALAANQCKVDVRERTSIDSGDLRRSINLDNENPKMKDGEIIVHVGTNRDQAIYQEFGTGIYAENGQGRKTPWIYDYQGNKGPKGPRLTHGNKPHPFFRPAFDQNKEKYKDMIKDAIEKGGS